MNLSSSSTPHVILEIAKAGEDVNKLTIVHDTILNPPVFTRSIRISGKK